MSRHILRNYADELDELKENVLTMGSHVLGSVQLASDGLIDADKEKCAEVIDEDEAIDELEKTIDERGMFILLRFNPVAKDLRTVLSSINICRSLERIGDHAVNIAKRGRKIIKKGEVEESASLKPLFDATYAIVDAAITALKKRDEDGAHAVIAMDAEVDRLHKSISKDLTRAVGDGGDHVASLLNLLFVSRSLERIGDLAVNVAEDVVFLTSAEDIRHTATE